MNTFKDNNMMKVAVIAVLFSAHSISPFLIENTPKHIVSFMGSIILFDSNPIYVA